MSYVGSPVEGASSRGEPPLPAVLERERGGLDGIGSGCTRECAEPLPFGGCRLELARERGERPTNRVVADVVRVVELADRLPERARLARRPLVADGLSDEHEPPSRTRAGRRKQIAVATRGHQAVRGVPCGAARASRRVSSSRKGSVRGRAWQRALLEAEHEDRVVAARARTQQVDDRDPPRRPGTLRVR